MAQLTRVLVWLWKTMKGKLKQATAISEQPAKLTREAPDALQQIKLEPAKPAAKSAPTIGPQTLNK